MNLTGSVIHTGTEPPTAEREWGSVGQQRHAHDAQAQEPVACCLLPAASCSRCCTSRLMLHRVASLRVCSEPISVSFAILLSLKSLKRIERRKGEGSLRFGGIFGNQSLDVIVGHINSALASQQCCIRILKTNVPPTASSGQLRLQLHLRLQLCLGSDWIDWDRLVSGISNYPKATARQAARRTLGRTIELSVILSFV